MKLRRSHTLYVLLRRGATGPVLAIETVTVRDLEDCLAEAWFEACLRRGAPTLAFDEVDARLHPLRVSGAARSPDSAQACLGFSLEVRGHHTVFTNLALETVAQRAELQLRKSGALAATENAYYELASEPVDVVTDVVERPGRAEPPRLLARELPEPLVPASADDGDYPVFYTPAARAKAEGIARKGGAESPPVETGGLLVGPLCRCPLSGEVFAVVEDVLAATHAKEKAYSLTFSGATWERIQAVMAERTKDPATSHQRILGQTHGHSFLPLEADASAAVRRELADLHTAFMSAEDLHFCRAVFAGEPWQLSHVFGLTAHGGEVDAFFGQRGGVLVPRSYRILDIPETQRTTQ